MSLLLNTASALSSVVSAAIIEVDDIAARSPEPRLDAPLAEAVAAIAAWTDSPAATDATRTMYKRVGLDPTKTRPSSEALLRRIRRGDPFPRINGVVDVINWTSVETQMSFGVYDLDKIDALGRVVENNALGRVVEPDALGRVVENNALGRVVKIDAASGAIELRLGSVGEQYAGIRKDAVHVAGRLVLVDAQGPFGNPTSDSQRTMVTGDTTRVLVVVFAPAGFGAAGQNAAIAARDRLRAHCSR